MCFSFYLLADRLFYKLYQAGGFPKFGVTLILALLLAHHQEVPGQLSAGLA